MKEPSWALQHSLERTECQLFLVLELCEADLLRSCICRFSASQHSGHVTDGQHARHMRYQSLESATHRCLILVL